MKSNPKLNFKYPNTRVYILFIAILFALFSCGKIIEGEDGNSMQNTDPPVGVIADANSVSSIIIGWGFVSGATGYYIYRSESAIGTYIQVGASATTSHEDSKLQAGTTYYYRVAAYNSGGIGSQSNLVSATTLPDEPNSVTARVNSTSSIIISWRAVTGATGYYIYSSTSANGIYEQIGVSTNTSYTNTGLSLGTTYYYKVAAYNDGGIGTQSSYASATMQPSIATAVTATANSNSSIMVSWATVSSATGYYIYRSTSANGTYTQVGSSTTNSYTNNNLSSNTTYYYKIAAYNSGGTGDQSSYTSATTLLDTPGGVTVMANSTSSTTISWETVSGATGYYIYLSESYYGTYSYVGGSTNNSYTNTGLSAGTTYYYTVAAYNNNGTGAQSSYISIVTLPSAPTGINATANSTSSITISWGTVSGATGYYISRSESVSGTYSYVGYSATSSYIDYYLSEGATYYYTVAAYNNSGTGAQSEYVSTTTLPSTPNNITAMVNSVSDITIGWGTVYGATGYNIYRSESYYGTYSYVGNSTTNSYTNTGLSAGTTYYYTVAAYNNSGTGAQSGYISIATLPSAPTGISATANSTNSITVSWGTVSGATGYYILRSESTIGTYNYIDYSTTTSYTDYSLSSNTIYYYIVVAYNNSGTGTQSSYISATTSYGSVSHGDQSYKTIKIDEQIWMAENLNYNVTGSVCYGNDPLNCIKYGRLYDWATAMNLPDYCNNTSCSNYIEDNHQGICPSGWHIPTIAEWATLESYVGISSAGRYLKVTSGWYSCGPSGNSYLCEDAYGFAALPGSFGYSDGGFYGVGYYGSWWSASESNAEGTYSKRMDYNIEEVITSSNGKSSLFSVRCVEN